MTEPERIKQLEEKLAKRDAQIARLKKRLTTKMKYEKGLLKGTGAHPYLIAQVEEKDLAVLEE